MTNTTLTYTLKISGLAVLMSILMIPHFALAQTTPVSSFGDDQLGSALAAADWGFPVGSIDTIKVKEFPTDMSVVFTVPAAMKGGKPVVDYFISVGENSFQSVKAGVASVVGEKEVQITNYSVVDGILHIPVKVTSKTQNMYMLISPTVSNQNGRGIEDYAFTLKDLQAKSTYKGMSADANPGSSSKAIAGINCIWDEKLKKITVRWIDSGLADKIAISYKPGTEQGTLKLQGTPSASSEKFTFNVTEVMIPYLDLQPQDSAGNQVGVDFRFECKADEHDVAVATKTETPESKTIGEQKKTVKKVITKVPHTGPVETMGGLLLVTVLLYSVYRRVYISS